MIFTIDVENSLKVLGPEALKLVVKIALQDYMYMDVAEQLRQDVRTIVRNYGKALDRLSVELLKRDLLANDGWNTCQEGVEFGVSI